MGGPCATGNCPGGNCTISPAPADLRPSADPASGSGGSRSFEGESDSRPAQPVPSRNQNPLPERSLPERAPPSRPSTGPEAVPNDGFRRTPPDNLDPYTPPDNGFGPADGFGTPPDGFGPAPANPSAGPSPRGTLRPETPLEPPAISPTPSRSEPSESPTTDPKKNERDDDEFQAPAEAPLPEFDFPAAQRMLDRDAVLTFSASHNVTRSERILRFGTPTIARAVIGPGVPGNTTSPGRLASPVKEAPTEGDVQVVRR